MKCVRAIIAVLCFYSAVDGKGCHRNIASLLPSDYDGSTHSNVRWSTFISCFTDGNIFADDRRSYRHWWYCWLRGLYACVDFWTARVCMTSLTGEAGSPVDSLMVSGARGPDVPVWKIIYNLNFFPQFFVTASQLGDFLSYCRNHRQDFQSTPWRSQRLVLQSPHNATQESLCY